MFFVFSSFANAVELKLGEKIHHEDIDLYFYDVEDSRCPLDVTCIWEGKVTAMIQVQNQTHKISEKFGIGSTLSSVFPYYVTLIDVLPHPTSIGTSDYVALLNITKSYSDDLPSEDFAEFVSPLKQFKDNTPFHEIKCNVGLQLTQRHDGRPACVKPETIVDLIKRGWAGDAILAVQSSPQTIIKTGTYAGFCLGYCVQDFVITSEKITYTQTGWDFVSDVREKLPPKTKEIPTSESKWQELMNSIDLQKFNSLPERIGCPGCADGIVEWIEISDGKKAKKIEFEPKDDVQEINQFVTMLREIRSMIASSVTSFEECVTAGNPPMESNPRQCITANGEHFIEETDADTVEPTTDVMNKRSPVNVPDATNENDMLCQTHWNIETTEKMSFEHIKESIQSTIAQFGITYVLEDREILVYESPSGYIVSISGLWDPESIQYLLITEDLENLFGMKITSEPAMCM